MVSPTLLLSDHHKSCRISVAHSHFPWHGQRRRRRLQGRHRENRPSEEDWNYHGLSEPSDWNPKGECVVCEQCSPYVTIASTSPRLFTLSPVCSRSNSVMIENELPVQSCSNTCFCRHSDVLVFGKTMTRSADERNISCFVWNDCAIVGKRENAGMHCYSPKLPNALRKSQLLLKK